MKVAYTAEHRAAALELIDDFLTEDEVWVAEEDDDAIHAWCAFDDDDDDDMVPNDRALEESDPALDLWSLLDRPMRDGTLPIDRLLARASVPGVRAYLEALSRTELTLYEVVDARPGEALTLHDLRTGRRVGVRERSGSRQLARFALVAARVVEPGVSGEPEIEIGALSFPRPMREALLEETHRIRREYSNPIERRFEQGLLYSHAWRASFRPQRPTATNTDGDPVLPSKVVFKVVDAERLRVALDGEPTLERSGDEWSWIGDTEHMKRVSLARIELRAERLFVHVNSAERALRAQQLIERISQGAAVYRATVHEDLEQARAAHTPQPPTPEASPEVLEQAVLEFQQRHYRDWLDQAIPMFGGASPRVAAEDPRKRGKVVAALKDLEHQYYRELGAGRPGFDPWWMWAELGLHEHPDAPGRHALPPPLAHESMARLVPGFARLTRDLAGRLAARADFDASRVVEGKELSDSLECQRFVRAHARSSRERGLSPEQATDEANLLGFWLELALNHELHLRKTFWLGDGLSTLLDETTADASADLLRLPFASFALVFTDRPFLGMVERLLAAEHDTPVNGQRLRAVTVYIADAPGQRREGERAVRVTLAIDAIGADWPYLLSRVLPIDPGKCVSDLVEAYLPEAEGSADPTHRSGRLARVLRVVLNAVLYATSAGVEHVPTKSQPPHPKAASRKKAALQTSDEVYHLPGFIDLQLARRVESLGRAPGGRELLHRFMVRGHWRRAAPGWADQRVRWVAPYWKGPDMAAVIERAYRLRPGQDPASDPDLPSGEPTTGSP
jgi:hypothetical protein